MIATTVGSVGLSSPPTAPPETSVTEAAEHLSETGARALVVLEDDTVVGVVTESDVVSQLAAASDPADRRIVPTPVATLSPTSTLAEAAERMRTTGVEHLPVGENGGYQGVVSARTLGPYLSRRNVDVERRRDLVSVDSDGRVELGASD